MSGRLVEEEGLGALHEDGGGEAAAGALVVDVHLAVQVVAVLAHTGQTHQGTRVVHVAARSQPGGLARNSQHMHLESRAACCFHRLAALLELYLEPVAWVRGRCERGWRPRHCPVVPGEADLDLDTEQVVASAWAGAGLVLVLDAVAVHAVAAGDAEPGLQPQHPPGHLQHTSTMQ